MNEPLELYCIQAPTFALDGGALFGVVPKVLWERDNPCDALNRVTLTTRCLLVIVGKRKILVDPGIGAAWDEKFFHRYQIQGQSIEESLHSIKVHPQEITDVVLTHVHFDHVGGCFHGKPGSLELAFPSARHWVQKEHWEYAQSPSPKDRGSFVPEQLEVLSKGDLRLVDGETEILDCILCIPVDGHTFSQQLIAISSNGKTFLYGADLYPMRSILNTSWVMAYDVEPIKTVDEKQRIGKRFTHSACEAFLILTHEPDIIGGIFTTGSKSLELTDCMPCEGFVTQIVYH